jgi:hypothetical protein
MSTYGASGTIPTLEHFGEEKARQAKVCSMCVDFKVVLESLCMKLDKVAA